ncbi:hypothetical protein ACHAQA_003714 [Verticillium albo-atrum]
MGIGDKFFGLRGKKLGWMIGFCAGMDFLLFGYDQGVMGGILTLRIFLDQFPEIDPDTAANAAESSSRATHQGISIASYNLGCFFGAILAIFIGNPLGRKRMIILGTAIMVVGAALQASAFGIAHLIVGRIITGLGNGINTSTVPTWQSETSSSHKRGKMVMFEGSLITAGIMISYWIDLGFSFAPGSVAWRFPLAFQIFFCLLILATVWKLPESPRWLMLKGRENDAREVISALADLPMDHQFVENEFVSIKETVAEMSKISGINLITYYAAVIYSGLGMSPFMSRLLAALNGTEYFLASLPPIWLVERVGRRKLMLFGAAGQAATMAILTGVNSQDGTGFKITGIVFLFIFNTFFAIGWLGMTWLYPAEIVPLRIRAPANGFSTSANWIWNFMVVMITPVSFNDIGHYTYLIFAVINAIIVPVVYFFYPETAYRSLEEMDVIFQKAKGAAGWFSVVQIAHDEPRRYGKNGELLIDHDDAEEKGHHMHHSVDGSDSTPADGMFNRVDDERKRTEN